MALSLPREKHLKDEYMYGQDGSRAARSRSELTGKRISWKNKDLKVLIRRTVKRVMIRPFYSSLVTIIENRMFPGDLG